MTQKKGEFGEDVYKEGGKRVSVFIPHQSVRGKDTVRHPREPGSERPNTSCFGRVEMYYVWPFYFKNIAQYKKRLYIIGKRDIASKGGDFNRTNACCRKFRV